MNLPVLIPRPLFPSCLQTDYFHLFLCVAIIVLYGEDVTEQQLATDQMLLHFSNLSMHMNGELVLRKVSQLNALALFAFLQDVVTFTERVYTMSYAYSAPVCTPKHAVPPRTSQCLHEAALKHSNLPTEGLDALNGMLPHQAEDL